MKNIFNYLFKLLLISVLIIINYGCNKEKCKECLECNESVVYNVTLLDYDDTKISTYTTTNPLPYIDKELFYSDNYYNYYFNKWEKKSENDSSITYKAVYTKQERLYKIQFDSDGGTLINGNDVQYLKYNSKIENPEFYKDMYQFIGFDKEIYEVTNDVTYKAVYKELTIRRIASIDLIKEITSGYNIVNLEDFTTEEKISGFCDLLLKSGINAINLVINWMKHCDDNYVINEEYLENIKMFVDVIIGKGMFVTLTSYDSYYLAWSSLNYAQYETTLEILNIQWNQIGNYFIDYNEKLMFSFLNEPRDYITNTYSREGTLILNLLNEAFIKKIRTQGGNNLYRHLFITTVWGKSSDKENRYFKIPDDKYIVISTHAYTPFIFVHDEDLSYSSWDDRVNLYQEELNNIFYTIKKRYLDNNIASMITEFGSRDKDNTEQRAKWLYYYLNVATNYGIKCFTWDSSQIGLDYDLNFSMIDKENMKWKYEEFEKVYVDLFVKGEILPMYKEIVNSQQVVDEEIIIPKYMTNMLTNEKVKVNVEYDKSLIKEIDGKYFALTDGTIEFKVTVNGYDYYYTTTIIKEYKSYYCTFEFETRLNPEKILQCYIITKYKPTMRVDYEWYSSDTNILSIDKYSSITINEDGVAAIIAINKKTREVGVLEVTVKNGTIVSTRSINNIDLE